MDSSSSCSGRVGGGLVDSGGSGRRTGLVDKRRSVEGGFVFVGHALGEGDEFDEQEVEDGD